MAYTDADAIDSSTRICGWDPKPRLTHVGAGKTIGHRIDRAGVGYSESTERESNDHESLFQHVFSSPSVNVLTLATVSSTEVTG